MVVRLIATRQPNKQSIHRRVHQGPLVLFKHVMGNRMTVSPNTLAMLTVLSIISPFWKRTRFHQLNGRQSQHIYSVLFSVLTLSPFLLINPVFLCEVLELFLFLLSYWIRTPLESDKGNMTMDPPRILLAQRTHWPYRVLIFSVFSNTRFVVCLRRTGCPPVGWVQWPPEIMSNPTYEACTPKRGVY